MENPNPRLRLDNTPNLIQSIQSALDQSALQRPVPLEIKTDWQTSSAVMFLMGLCPAPAGHPSDPCLVLNKRSDSVRQPGDLCFPGGGVSPLRDRMAALALRYLWAPLKQRAVLPSWRHADTAQTKARTLHLAVALREAWEEIRLNPLRVRLLGYLPLQRLQIIGRTIWPVVGWVHNQRSFKPNWEVRRIVYIPLKNLLDPSQYARFQPRIKAHGQSKAAPLHEDEFPCFVHRDSHGRELLWGATYRMVEDFLRIVFDFEVPGLEDLHRVEGFLSPNYLQTTPMAH